MLHQMESSDTKSTTKEISDKTNKDEFALFINMYQRRLTFERCDNLTANLGEGSESINEDLLSYWLAQEAKWLDLAQMAFHMLTILAMSSECKRVFFGEALAH